MAVFFMKFVFKEPVKQWQPAFEDIQFHNFDYALDTAFRDVCDKDIDLSGALPDSLSPACKGIIKLKYYFLPMIKVRQLIYEADRLCFFNQFQDAAEKLESARVLLFQNAQFGDIEYKKGINELIILIDDMIHDVKNENIITREKFLQLADYVNKILQ